MKLRHTWMVLTAAAAGGAIGWNAHTVRVEAAAPRVFELRTYTAAEGKLPNLLARFRDHTVKLFEQHGMTNVGYWVPQDEPLKNTTLIYVLAHSSREAAKKSWDAFRTDPAWLKAREASEVGGRLAVKVESVYLDATDFSALK